MFNLDQSLMSIHENAASAFYIFVRLVITDRCTSLNSQWSITGEMQITRVITLA